MLKNTLLLAVVVGVALSSPSAKIESSILTSLAKTQSADVMVRFVGGTAAVLNAFEAQPQTFASRGHKITSLKNALKRTTDASQEKVKAFLQEQGVQFKSFWISNKISLRGADKNLIEALAAFPEVEVITQERVIQIDTPTTQKSDKPVPLAEWGIERIQAEAAWRITNGSGVIVSSVDTGVRHTHEAIREQYRNDGYGWFDPYQGEAEPEDRNGHGTHTMGTICGTHGIGVAPGAKWMSCRGCYTSSCGEAELTACGEWTLCPTRPDGTGEDCSKAPALSSNSWGGPGGDTWWEDVTEAWVVGGIVPLASIGNNGNGCSSCGSPGDYRRVIGVGSTNVANEISYYSSSGPARRDGRLKPEISGPGENVRSSIPDSDSAYGTKSGTSMSCPHAAGVTALLLSLKPDLTFGQVRQALLAGTDHQVESQGLTCSGVNDSQWPNHQFGWGIINALKVAENASRN